jgi:hypothetical protein
VLGSCVITKQQVNKFPFIHWLYLDQIIKQLDIPLDDGGQSSGAIKFGKD